MDEQKRKKDVLDILNYHAYVIMKTISNEKYPFYSVLLEKTGIVRSTLNYKINQLLEFDLINVEYIQDKNTKQRSKPRALYKLTDKGQEVLKCLEKIREICSKS